MVTHHRLLAIALVCLLAWPLLAAAPEERTLTLPWKSSFSNHVWVQAGALALTHCFRLGEGPVAVIRASDCSAGTWQQQPGRENPSPVVLEFFLEIPQAGKWWVWHRLRAPEAMTVKHLEGVDASLGASIGWVSHDLPAGEWRWVRREAPWNFPAGLHELQMDQWTPGVELDRIALTTDENWTPEAGLPEPLAPTLWTEGVAYTADAYPSTVLGWKGLELSEDLAGGQVNLSYSTDGGKTWTPVPDSRNLSGLAVKSDGSDRIRFRVELRRSPQGASPRLGPVALTYTGDRDDLFALEDQTARFFFSQRNGALCGIQNAVTGTWLTPERRPQPLFSVRLRPVMGAPEKDWETVTSLDAKCLSAAPLPSREGGRGVGSATFVYEIVRTDGTARVTLKCAQTGPGELTWTVEVANGLRQFEIVDLTYPVAYGVKASERPADDTMLINGNYLVKFPATFGRFLYWWPTNTAPLMDVFSPREGLALIAHDKTMRSTGLSCRGLEREAVELSLVKAVRIKPGERFSGAPHILRVHQGDWHATALAERRWLAETWPTAEPPLWLAECDGWVPTGWPAGWWVNMGQFADRMRMENGFGWIQYWNFQVPGTTWTIPHPNPINGSEEELRWGIDQIHRRGMRTTFYIQGLLYDPAGDGTSPDDPIGHLHRRDLWPGFELPGPGFADQWARRTADGEIYEWSPTEREMCYASRGFQEYKRKWAIDRFMGRLGLDGIYWDSLSRGDTCWGSDHGHGDDPGQWGIGAQANHALILQQARKLNPTAVFATEGPPVDTLGQVIDVHLDNAPNLDVVRFLFPRMLVYLGTADGADPQRRKAFLYGCRFDGIGLEPDQQALLRIRRLTKQYLYPATPMDTLGLKIENPSSGAGSQPAQTLQARWFLCDPKRTRGAVVNILNEQKVAGATITVDTSAVGEIRTAWVVDADGADGPLAGGESLDGGRAYRFPVPAAFASTILLFAESAEPRVTVENDTLLARGGETQVKVRLESLTGERVQGTVSLVSPAGFSSSPAAFEVSGAGDRGRTVVLSLRANDNAPLGLTDVPVEVKVPGGPTFCKVATFYVEPPVRVTPEWVRPELLRVTLENASTLPRSGRVTLRPAAGEVRFAQQADERDFRLGPGEKTTWEIPLVGGYTCQVPWAVKGELQVGGAEYPLYTPFRPPILNGSLELYKWRQDVPDWWWGTYVDRSPKIWGTGEYGIDDTMAADGTHSFKVVGKADEWRAANLDLVLKPGQTYRFHAKIRRTAHAPGISASIYEGRRLPDGKIEGISHMIGRQTEGPLNEWQTFETIFTALPLEEQAGARLYLYNDHSPATVWFDDLRLVPEEIEHPSEKQAD